MLTVTDFTRALLVKFWILLGMVAEKRRVWRWNLKWSKTSRMLSSNHWSTKRSASSRLVSDYVTAEVVLFLRKREPFYQMYVRGLGDDDKRVLACDICGMWQHMRMYLDYIGANVYLCGVQYFAGREYVVW